MFQFLTLVAVATAIYLWIRLSAARRILAETAATLQDKERVNIELADQIALLAKYQQVVDAERRAREIHAAAQAEMVAAVAAANAERAAGAARAAEVVAQAEAQARGIVSVAQAELANARTAAANERSAAVAVARAKVAESEAALASTMAEVQRMLAAATVRAEEIAGDAYAAKLNADSYEKAVKALKNIVEGYGDAYIVPTYSLLDELADEFGFTEAGEELKRARERTRMMVKAGQAGVCDYVEASRRDTAVRFVTDAFNGKVDSILSRSKSDNFGTLRQQITDAFNLVNMNGAAFRNARITQDYLDARLAELKWAVVAQELRDRDKEEQRRIKEQIREEERARREFEKAIRDSAQEEETIRKAMEKVMRQVDQATDAQRVEFEAKLAELSEKLRLAEERNQRAMSMAQQTRAGHVYVISNVGSFGEEIFKIGMTRRLEPKDRVRELGDASVPFEFDIHAMIYSEDAPTLETAMHRRFMKMQVNKVNPRKEFFRLPLAEIRKEIDASGAEATWTMLAAAREYRETLAIERALREDPEAQAEWVEKQLEMEAVPQDDEESESMPKVA